MNFEKIKEMPCFEKRLDSLKKEYGKKEKLPKLTRELFDSFYETGSRSEYEEPYFKRRSTLLNAALVYFIYKDGIDYLSEVMEDICSEFTWALPAHMAKENPHPERVIDLFSAETAQALSEICAIACDALPEKVISAVKRELMRRIILPFEEESFAWESFTHNWAAVCGGAVGMTFLYMFPERFARSEKRIINALKSYISGFGSDGISPEGLGYWTYGFWYYTGFADLYKKKCGIDILKGEKIKNIAMCQQNLFLKGKTVVSYSDCGRTENFSLALAHYYKHIFPNDIKLISTDAPDGVDNCYRFLIALRSMLWIDGNLLGIKESAPQESYFADSEWYVNRKKDFAFSAKGGNNAESHNHNDIGCFSFIRGEKTIISDLGAPDYDRDYFSEKRYESFNASSRGHSVPIVNGFLQSDGAEYTDDGFEKQADGVQIIMYNAYPKAAGLSFLKRSLKLCGGLVICDSFKFTGEKNLVCERLITRYTAEKKENSALIKDGDNVICKIYADKDCTLKISREKINIKINSIITVIDFIFENVSNEFEVSIMLE